MNVKVVNATSYNLPFHVTAYNNEGTIVHNEWVAQPEKENIVPIPFSDYERITVNGAVPFEDYNRKNNHFRPGKLFRKGGVALKYLGQQRDSYSKTILWSPYGAYNKYDGAMVGVALYNSFFPYNDLRWYVAPSYGLKSGQFGGNGAIEKDFRGNGKGAIWTVGMEARKYLYDNIDGPFSQELTYTKLVPTVRLTFKSEGSQHKTIDYKLHHIKIDEFCPDLCQPGHIRSNVHQINYRTTNARRLSQMSSLVQLEYESYSNVFGDDQNYLKLSLEHNRSIYYTKGSKIHMRFFGGYFPVNSQRESANYSDAITRGSFALAQTGNTDHTLEGYYFGRNEQEGGFAKQIQIAEGGFKTALGNVNANSLSNNYLLATNLKVDMPFSILGARIRPFVDVAYLSNKGQLSEELSGEFYYSGGLALELGEVAGIYFSLLNSDNLSLGDFSDKISFKVDISKLNFWRMAENPGALLR